MARADNTLRKIATEAFEVRKAELKGDGKAGRWFSPLDLHVLPKLGKVPVEELDQRDIRDALAPIWHTKADTARKDGLYKRLSFAGVKFVTLSEGEISHLHIGPKGTMNALYLQDLADKTRRGLRGRVQAGKSGGGNSYGYDVVRRIGDHGEAMRGERPISKRSSKALPKSRCWYIPTWPHTTGRRSAGCAKR